MTEWTIYYNPKCGTCRKVLAALEVKGIHPKIVEYLKRPPSEKDLDNILKLSGLEPQDIVRRKEPLYGELGLDSREPDRREWLKVLSENPILIERPIVHSPGRSGVVRPPEKIAEFF